MTHLVHLMPAKLPVNLNDLLRQRTVEGERIEYKAGWNPDPILRTLCAIRQWAGDRHSQDFQGNGCQRLAGTFVRE